MFEFDDLYIFIYNYIYCFNIVYYIYMDALISFPWLVVPHLITEKEMWFRIAKRSVDAWPGFEDVGPGFLWSYGVAAQTWQRDRENG